MCPPPPAARERVGSMAHTLFLWGSARGTAREPLIAPQSRLQRPQTLMNNPTHPPPEKKFAQMQRRRRKTKTRAPWPRAPNPARAPPPQRRGPTARKRLDSGARTCRGNTDIANTTYKTAAAYPWLVRAAPFCAKTRFLHSASAAACDPFPPPAAPAPDSRPSFPSPLPPAVSARAAAMPRFFLRLLSSTRLGLCFFALVAVMRASVARERRLLASAFAGSATQPDYCETRPLGVRVAGRYGSRVRLSGTALRYGSQVQLRFPPALLEWCLCYTTSRFVSSPTPTHLPNPYRRTFKAHTHAHPRTFHAHSKPHPRN
jgi:hypothetical protein